MTAADGDLTQAVFDRAGVGMYAYDGDGTVTACNQTLTDLLGWGPAHLVGRSAHAMFHDRDVDGRPQPAATCRILQAAVIGVADHEDDDLFWKHDGTALPVWWVAAPIPAAARPDGRSAGVVVFGDATDRHLRRRAGAAALSAARDGEAAAVRAARTAQAATEQARAATRAAEAETARLSTLAALSELLNSLDVESGLDAVAAMAADALADWCVIDRIDGRTVTRVSLAAPNREARELARLLGPLPDFTAASSGPLAVVARGASRRVVVDLHEPQRPTDPLDVEQADLFRELGAGHAVLVALAARGSVLGAMTWVRREGAPPFDEADLLMASLFGLRIGQWMDNLRLLSVQQRAAVTLQRSLLTDLPQPDYLHIAARYLPAAEGVEVGGDWYDAMLSYDGHTVLAIGDVTGHDIDAAARMAQLRNMLRFAALDAAASPAAVLARVDAAMPALAISGQATAVAATITRSPSTRAGAAGTAVATGSAVGGRSGDRELVWSNAGHPPPLVLDADGGARLLHSTPDLLLGVDPMTRRHDHRATLSPGSTVVLYTDGLVERRDEDPDVGVERLRQAVEELADQTLDDLLDGLLKLLTPDEGPLDDIAVVAVRLHPEDRPRPDDAGPEVLPGALRSSRP